MRLLLIALMLLSASLFSINATSSTYSIGRFAIGVQGGTGNSSTIAERHLMTAFQPGSDDGESAAYEADAGFFDMIIEDAAEAIGKAIAALLMSNAIISFAGVLVFMVLYAVAYIEKKSLEMYVWMGGIILIFIQALAVQRYGFWSLNLVAAGGLAFSILDVLSWIFFALFLLASILVLRHGMDALKKFLGGEEYG